MPAFAKFPIVSGSGTEYAWFEMKKTAIKPDVKIIRKENNIIKFLSDGKEILLNEFNKKNTSYLMGIP